MDKPRVYKANALIEAGYRLTVAEHRILLACIAQVKRNQPISDKILYTVTALDVAERSGVTRQTAYADLKAATDRLFERYVTVPYAPDGGSPVIRKFRWVQAIEYVESEGLVRLQFSDPVLPYLHQLTERFTVYRLEDVARMTSAHAIRLYEMLMQWKGSGEREVEIEWLKRAFQLEGQYKALQDFKRRVIEPAVNQINEMSPLWVKWDQLRKGRKVSHLVFRFGLKAQRQESGKISRKKPSHDYILGVPRHVVESQANPGESWEDAARRLKARSKATSGSG